MLSHGGKRKVKIGEESERRVTAMVCRLRWEGTLARSRLARRIVRLQRAHTAMCAQMAWDSVPCGLSSFTSFISGMTLCPHLPWVDPACMCFMKMMKITPGGWVDGSVVRVLDKQA